MWEGGGGVWGGGEGGGVGGEGPALFSGVIDGWLWPRSKPLPRWRRTLHVSPVVL